MSTTQRCPLHSWRCCCCNWRGAALVCSYANDIDLFLDTAVYTAHSTASDALWAGVPIVTLFGAAFQVRCDCAHGTSEAHIHLHIHTHTHTQGSSTFSAIPCAPIPSSKSLSRLCYVRRRAGPSCCLRATLRWLSLARHTQLAGVRSRGGRACDVHATAATGTRSSNCTQVRAVVHCGADCYCQVFVPSCVVLV